ncbi:transcription factor bHLH30 [Magnolia sinica]|uniref:transcription factor bHLH30 n=1 Tax=Magnolia sinica TaxID=86752 RepID=UPI00265ACAF7|nr:transcription factor bHLH30 [Magnolia sinica]
MCGKKVENQEETSQRMHDYQTYQDQMLHSHQYTDGFPPSAGLLLPENSHLLPWSIPPVHNLNALNPVQFSSNPVRDLDHFLPSPSSSSYSGLFSRRASALQFGYDGSSSDPLALASLYGTDTLMGTVGGRAGSGPFSLQAELGKMTAQEIMDAKALAASKSHSEAERRRRERINKHLARLRSLLPSTTKTDKASLLAEVIQHVKELKRQTSEIAEASPVPTEVDELTVESSDEDGNFVIKASLCCDDRSDLLPDLIKTLKALRLRTLKAEITTLGGRVRNVLLITGEEEAKNSDQQHCINSIQDALKAVMERTAADDSSSGSLKRQRTNISILEHRSI